MARIARKILPGNGQSSGHDYTVTIDGVAVVVHANSWGHAIDLLGRKKLSVGRQDLKNAIKEQVKDNPDGRALQIQPRVIR